jgi:hypothetical protein
MNAEGIVVRSLPWVALLLFASTARAALVTFDVSGTGGSLNTVSASASDPTLPPDSVADDAQLGWFFIRQLSPGSSITVETDRNGDGVGGDWQLVSGTLNVDETLPVYAIGSVVIDETISLAGGEAALFGDQVWWSQEVPTSWSAVGTWQCVGASLCAIIGLPEGAISPIGTLAQYVDWVEQNPTNLGIWLLDRSHSTIGRSNQLVTQLGGPSDPAPGLPAEWVQLGLPPIDGWLPEPGTGALGLLSAAALGYVARARRAAQSDSQRCA